MVIQKYKYASKILTILPIIVILVFLTSCKTVISVSNRNIAQLYNPSALVMHPEFQVYHLNDSISRIYFKISSTELLYLKNDTSSFYSSNFELSYRLLNTYDSKFCIDSGNVKFLDYRTEDTKKNIFKYIDFPTRLGNNYVLDISMKDENRMKISQFLINIQKKDKLSRQNFLISDKKNNPLYRNYVTTYETFSIKYDKSVIRSLTVYYFNREFPLAPPPFSANQESNFNPKPDSVFQLMLNDTFCYEMQLPKKGFYHFLADTSSLEGMTIFVYYNDFPKITTAEQMLSPIRYLTPKSEFQRYSLMKNKKDAIDEFWIQCGGNPERARELIRRYYNRVQDANRFFSSYTEGWKTDRGMIYLVFGIPNFVYRTNNGENWIYGEDNNINSLSFTFVRVENPFTDNDYMLLRIPEYRMSWHNAVEIWRR